MARSALGLDLPSIFAVFGQIFQAATGMKFYKKSMRVGTFVLVLAITCLIEIGPAEQEHADPLARLDPRRRAASSLSLLPAATPPSAPPSV